MKAQNSQFIGFHNIHVHECIRMQVLVGVAQIHVCMYTLTTYVPGMGCGGCCCCLEDCW